MKAERHALFLLATCLALGVGVVASAAATSRSRPSAAEHLRWDLLVRSTKKTTCGCRTDASAGWSRRGGVGVRGGAVVSDQYNARMQVMITRNMRKVLVDELDYLPDEVDDMDPQIAAVVIEKSLPRPRAGMPIAWRRSIRQTGSNGPPNPFRYLTDAIQATLEGVVNGAVAVVAFPFVLAGKAAGAARRGGATGVAAAALCLGVVAALVTSSESPETAVGEGNDDELSPRAAGLQALGANLAAARTMLLSRRKGGGDGSGDDTKSETPPSGRETHGGGDGDGGGVKKAVAGAGAGKAGGRRDDTEDQKEPKVARGKQLTRDDAGGGSSSSGGGGGSDSYSSSGRRRSAAGKFGETSSHSYNNRNDRDDEDGDGGRGSSDDVGGDDRRYSASGRDDLGAKKKPRTKRPSAQVSEERDSDDFGRQKDRVDASRKRQPRGFGASGGEGGPPRERWSSEERRADGAGGGAGGTGGGERGVMSQRLKMKAEGKRRRRDEGDGEEVCPDAPVTANAGGAVWFEDLPPAPPAPDTIGVLDEEEEEGLLALGADQEWRPRWGRRPMSEHIPSEEEMETWDSKIEASDTWLDRGINKAMGSLFGGGGGGGGNGEK